MGNQLQIFKNKEFGEVRVIEIDDTPWFVGKDVAEALGYANTKDALKKHVETEDRTVFQRSQNATFEIPTRGLTIINESGLYSLIMSSNLPSAKKFKRWVTSEVLPSIRKHGAYIIDAVLEEAVRSQKFANELLGKLQAEKGKTEVLLDKIEELAPKARYCDIILQSRGTMPISIIAKDYGMSAMAFNNLLHGMRIQYKLGKTWLLYQQYADMGYTKTKTHYINETMTSMYTCWTQAGRLFLYETLKVCGIIPLMEYEPAIFV